MSCNMGVFILQNQDQYRVKWSPFINRDANMKAIFAGAPSFMDKESAMSFADIVDKANNTEYGIVVVNRSSVKFHEME